MKKFILAIIIFLSFPAVALADPPYRLEYQLPITPSVPISDISTTYDAFNDPGTPPGGLSASSIDISALLSPLYSLPLVNGIIKGALDIWNMAFDIPFVTEFFILYFVINAVFWMAHWIMSRRRNRAMGIIGTASTSNIKAVQEKVRKFNDSAANNPWRRT